MMEEVVSEEADSAAVADVSNASVTEELRDAASTNVTKDKQQRTDEDASCGDGRVVTSGVLCDSSRDSPADYDNALTPDDTNQCELYSEQTDVTLDDEVSCYFETSSDHYDVRAPVALSPHSQHALLRSCEQVLDETGVLAHDLDTQTDLDPADLSLQPLVLTFPARRAPPSHACMVSASAVGTAPVSVSPVTSQSPVAGVAPPSELPPHLLQSPAAPAQPVTSLPPTSLPPAMTSHPGFPPSPMSTSMQSRPGPPQMPPDMTSSLPPSLGTAGGASPSPYSLAASRPSRPGPPVVRPVQPGSPYSPPQTTHSEQPPAPRVYQTPPAAAAQSFGVAIPTEFSPPVSDPEPDVGSGLFGWLGGGGGFVSKMLDKTKSGIESVITTMDPGMKEVVYSGGDVGIVVASAKDVKISPVRQAFQDVFGMAVVTGQDSQPDIAPQPVGFTAGLKGAEQRIDRLRRAGHVDERQACVAVENFIVELTPDQWFDMGCVLLRDPARNIELCTYTQATPIPTEYVTQAHERTSADYPLRWSGLAVTVGHVISHVRPEVDHADWHVTFTGVSRRTLIEQAARSLAGLYRQRLGL